MNIEAWITLAFIVVGIVWGFWLIFKRDLMQNQLGKLISYFLGVVVTLVLVMWLASQFLPWWATRLIQNTQQSPNVDTLQQVSTELLNQLSNPSTVVDTPATQPTTAPGTGVSPISAPAGSSSQSVPPSGNSRTHTVQAGENLYRISLRYGTTVDAIKARNSLTSDVIRVGQVLVIP